MQREQDPLPMGFPNQASTLLRATPVGERDQSAPSMDLRPSVDTLHEEEEEEQDKEVLFHSHKQTYWTGICILFLFFI